MNGPPTAGVTIVMTGSNPPPPMLVKLNRYNPLRLLNSVPFGIVLMVAIALYMAIGSGRPWLRATGLDQWSMFRDWFDKTDLEFFNSWPLKTLMVLLVLNLVVVTWRKIPLTPPRYGVWCIHAGIITLILGAGVHYSLKVEGRVRLFADPTMGPNTVESFYDKDERALYVRTGRETPVMFPLPTLPRFQQYDDMDGTGAALAGRKGLTNIEPAFDVADNANHPVRENVAMQVEPVGFAGDMRVDVVGFYPYATVQTSFDQTDPASTTTGVELSMSDPNDPAASADWYVVGSDPRYAVDNEHIVDLEHSTGNAVILSEAAGQLFHVDVTVPGVKEAFSTYVKLGQRLPVGKSGYTLEVLHYNPSWSLFGSGEPAHMLEMMVTSPTQKFRRMVLEGKPTQTDFKLDAQGAGPMGKRMPKPLDEGLKIDFRVEDPYHLLPSENSVKHTLVTPADSTGLLDIEAGYDGPATVHTFPNGRGEIAIAAPASETGAMPEGQPEHPVLHIHLERRDHLKPVDSVHPVPANKRDENADENGDFQVVKLHVHMGSWSQDVIVPYAAAPYEKLKQDVWRGGYVSLPGGIAPLQFQLGNTRRPLPVRLTLDSFAAVPYAGGQDTPTAMFKDYRSTVTLGGADDSDTQTEVAALNSPIYFDGGRWLVFQASYDPNVPHTWTMLGVGNRPAVRVIATGCVMIVLGLLYAFYAKPVIIRRMKERAIAAAAEAKAARAAAVAEPELLEV